MEGVVTSWKKMPSFFSAEGFFVEEEDEDEDDEGADWDDDDEEAGVVETAARGLPGTASGLSTTPGTSALTVTSALLAPGSSCGRALAIAPLTKAASCAGLDAATAAAEAGLLELDDDDDFLLLRPFSELIEAASLVAAEDMFS